MTIIVDGYNVIYKWKSLDKFVYNMELARNRLMNILANYQGYVDQEVIVVFDGSSINGNRESFNGPENIRVFYASGAQGADIFISQMVYKHANCQEVMVVTGDSLERMSVAGMGARTMSPERFEQEVDKVCGHS